MTGRTSGILLHITSLPGAHGVGTLGREAYAFVDFLARAGQTWWQILPLGPTGFGDSPYQTDTAFGGNPYLIDLDLLAEEGLLTPEEIGETFWGDDPGRVDFAALYAGRPALLALACERGWDRDAAGVDAFRRENPWVKDYALFRAVKEAFQGAPWTAWPEDIRLRRPEAVAAYRTRLEREMRAYIYAQFLFFRQWSALRGYARERGVKLLGDVPIYVPLDSADVWAEPQWFCLDGEGNPTEVAGVPPDYFSADGQLWGNPLYDWSAMAADGYGWWLRRMGQAARLYDGVRIDHFRGFASYWAVPFGAETARNGRWCPGPGADFTDALRRHLPDTELIAEDLGILTEDVYALMAHARWPGMKVLSFAFDASRCSTHLPHGYDKNCLCYTGTHDNAPLMQWWAAAPEQDRAFAAEYLGLGPGMSFCRGAIRAGMASAAGRFIAPMQDWLELGAEGRMNTPGTLGGGNWCWRMAPGTASDDLADEIARLTRMYGRGS